MGFYFPPLSPGIKRVIIVLVAVFVVQLIVASTGPAMQAATLDWFALSLDGILSGRVWQPFTYMLLHAVDGWGHLLWNLLALYLFGAPLEARVGRKAIYKLVIGGGVLGALFCLARDGIGLATDAWSPAFVVGASGGVSAVLAATCWLRWNEKISLVFLTLTGKQLLLLLLFVDVLRSVGPGRRLSLAAHLGGYAFGLLWTTGWIRPRYAYLQFKRWNVKRKLKVVHRSDPDERGPYLH